jgi:hypothetical protein
MQYTAGTSPPHVYPANRLVSPSVGRFMTMDYELNQRNGSASSPSPSPTFGLPYDQLSESSSLAGSSVTTLSDHRSPYHFDQYQVRIYPIHVHRLFSNSVPGCVRQRSH